MLIRAECTRYCNDDRPPSHHLPLASSAFTGTLPADFGDLGSHGNGVVGINLANNRLSGWLPPSMVHLKALQELDVAGNQFVGLLPRLHNLPLLEASRVNFTGNVFDCPIPMSTRTSTLYDTAKCVCKAGSHGVEDSNGLDGLAWVPSKCRDSVTGVLDEVCLNRSCMCVYVCVCMC